MLDLNHGQNRLCDGLTRRRWLSIGSLVPLGLSLPAWMTMLRGGRAGERAGASRRADACIQVFLWGGPGQHETWDLKPDAPSGVRGDFRPIDTSVPGTRICEHLPLMAARADRYTLVRSLTHTGVNHGTSAYHMLTGHIHRTPGTLRHPEPNDVPNWAASAGRFMPHPAELPAHVQLPAVINDGDGLPVPGQGAGFLGPRYEPFQALGDLTQPSYRVPSLSLPDSMSRQRLEGRAGLRRLIDARMEHLSRQPEGAAADDSFQRALELVSSPRTEAAFDLSRESTATRERYGIHHFAQGLLLARRLVEAGVPLVTVYWNSPKNSDDQSWDTHVDQHRRMKERLLPAFDRAMAALLDELAERGLLERTLVTWYGEFGRTPKINGQGGREHWGFCQSAGLAGGGTKAGLVHGSSTPDGGYAATDPLSPDDLSATMFDALGIDPRALMHDLSGRPAPLSYGTPARALFS